MAIHQLTERQQSFVDGLREMADFLETHADLIPEYGNAQISHWAYSDIPAVYAEDENGKPDYSNPVNKADMEVDVKRQMARVARIMGTCDKRYSGTLFALVKNFGPHTLEWQANREAICRKVVTGQKTVEKTDPAAPKVLVTEDVVEWVCDEPLLRAADPDADAGSRDAEYANER